MKFLTRDILPFYKNNNGNNWYIKKLFSNTKEVGVYKPFRENAVSSQRSHIDHQIETIDEVMPLIFE